MNKYLLLIFFFIINAKDYSWENSPSQKYINKSINQLYNYRFSESLKSLSTANSLDSNHALIPFLKIVNKWLLAQTSLTYENSYKSIKDEVSNAVKVYNNKIIDDKNNAEYYLYLGSSYGLLCRVNLAKNQYIRLLYNGYHALKYIDIAHSIDSNLYDIYLPLGMMEYYNCKSPYYIKKLASIFNFSSDCNSALQSLEISSKKSYYSWPEATNALAFAYLYLEKDYDKAYQNILRLTNEFPDNPNYPFLEADIYLEMNKNQEFENLIPTLKALIETSQANQKNECLIKLRYLYAKKAFKDKDIYQSMLLCNQIINNYKMEMDWLLGLVYLLRGKSYDILGHREQAINDYKEVRKYTQFFPEYIEAEHLLKKPYDA